MEGGRGRERPGEVRAEWCGGSWLGVLAWRQLVAARASRHKRKRASRVDKRAHIHRRGAGEGEEGFWHLIVGSDIAFFDFLAHF